MRRRIAALLPFLFWGLFVSESAFGQWIYITPPGGVAIKSIQPREDGWVMVTFVDSYPELASCPSVPMGGVPNANPVWINPATGVGAKQIYATTLLASVTGKKLRQVTIVYQSGGCMLVNVTTSE